MEDKKYLYYNELSMQCPLTGQANEPMAQRRTANYKPNIWDYEFLQSLSSEYEGQTYITLAENLKEYVRRMFKDSGKGQLVQLELVDGIQRLGLGYLFEKEINGYLDTIMIQNKNNDGKIEEEEDLIAAALRFRLLRQNGHQVSQDVFKDFIRKTGSLKGMLNLYEASHLASEGEDILEEAKAFTSRYLKNISKEIDPNLAKQVGHALEVPLHWKVQWLNARWHINSYEKGQQMNPILLELAKLNFNMVQAAHQRDLKEISRWWRNLGLADKLGFARDRSVESFLWSVGVAFEPQYGSLRKVITKVVNLILIIDDFYDIYGLFDELELFTKAVDRWDSKEMEELPNYMKICSLTLYNTTYENATDIEKEQGLNVIPYLKKVWVDFCKALMVEANWYHKGYTPSLEEYLDNAWISSGGALILVHAFFSVRPKMEVLEFLESNWDLVYYTSMIIRLCNDLGTSKVELERGDVPSSVLCYMRKENVGEEMARKHIRGMIIDLWKKMNKACATQSHLPIHFIKIILNVARVAHCIYQHGDGFGVQDRETKDQVVSLLIKPIVLNCNEAFVSL